MSALPQVKLQFTAPTQSVLNSIGNNPISRIQIKRFPVAAFIEKFFQLITAGQWGQVKQKYGYDNFYHLALVLYYESGETVQMRMKAFVGDDILGGSAEPPAPSEMRFTIEKLELINIQRSTSIKPNTDYQDVPLNGKTITLNEMVNRTRTMMGDEKFFTYDAFTNNCQVFVKSLLQSVGLLTPNAMSFLFQPVDKLIKELPGYTSQVARFVTDLGGLMRGVVDGYQPTGNNMLTK
jgi:hypothetical protein